MRCYERIAELRAEGRTIVLVSHSLDTIRALCTQTVWLADGEVRAFGDSLEVTRKYLEEVHGARNDPDASGPHHRFGTGQVDITEVRFLLGNGAQSTTFRTGQPMTIRAAYRASQPVSDAVCAIAIYRSVDHAYVVGQVSSAREATFDLSGEGEIEFSISALPLLPGTYLVSVGLQDKALQEVYDWHDRRYSLIIFKADDLPAEMGIAHVEGQWSAIPVEPAPKLRTLTGSVLCRHEVQVSTRERRGLASVYHDGLIASICEERKQVVRREYPAEIVHATDIGFDHVLVVRLGTVDPSPVLQRVVRPDRKVVGSTEPTDENTGRQRHQVLQEHEWRVAVVVDAVGKRQVERPVLRRRDVVEVVHYQIDVLPLANVLAHDHLEHVLGSRLDAGDTLDTSSDQRGRLQTLHRSELDDRFARKRHDLVQLLERPGRRATEVVRSDRVDGCLLVRQNGLRMGERRVRQQ